MQEFISRGIYRVDVLGLEEEHELVVREGGCVHVYHPDGVWDRVEDLLDHVLTLCIV